MISAEKIKEIKKTLGGKYAVEIAHKAFENGIVDAEGKSYSPNYVVQVLAGRINNLAILNTILVEYNYKKRQIKQTKSKINKM